MRSVKLLAASVDGGNVSPDGCHTPVVKEFFGRGPSHAESAGSESRAGSAKDMWRQIRELQITLGI